MIRENITTLISVITITPLPFIAVWVLVVSQKLASRLEPIFEISPLVLESKCWMKHMGLVGKVLFCSSIFAICINCRFCIWKGWVDEKEVLAVTPELKLALYPPFMACGIWTLALIACDYFIWSPARIS